MEQHFQYGVACALEEVPASWPINLRGSIDYLTQTASRSAMTRWSCSCATRRTMTGSSSGRPPSSTACASGADATGRELIENGLSLISADPGVRRAAIDRLKLHADMCSELGCLLIEGSMRSSIPGRSARRAVAWTGFARPRRS